MHPDSHLSRLFAFLSRLVQRVGRDRPFTRREQLSLVGASHLGILVGALVIEEVFALSSGLQGGFILGELAIIFMALPFSINVSFPGLGNLAKLAAGPPPERHVSESEEAERKAERKERVENNAGIVLILASIVQFAALALLLWGTGGPIASPFAEMTLIVAVFTPFIANKPRTIGVVVVASITYYATFIFLYATTHPSPDTPSELQQALSADPSVWAYFAVNIMILLGGISFTVLESLLRSAEMEDAAREASGEPESTESDDRPPDDEEEGAQPA